MKIKNITYHMAVCSLGYVALACSNDGGHSTSVNADETFVKSLAASPALTTFTNSVTGIRTAAPQLTNGAMKSTTFWALPSLDAPGGTVRDGDVTLASLFQESRKQVVRNAELETVQAVLNDFVGVVSDPDAETTRLELLKNDLTEAGLPTEQVENWVFLYGSAEPLVTAVTNNNASAVVVTGRALKESLQSIINFATTDPESAAMVWPIVHENIPACLQASTEQEDGDASYAAVVNSIIASFAERDQISEEDYVGINTNEFMDSDGVKFQGGTFDRNYVAATEIYRFLEQDAQQ